LGRIANILGDTGFKAFPGQRDGAALWRESFGTIKERPPTHSRPNVDGGSYGRSTISQHAAVKRLVQALASMAPGGWSDDRFQQTKSYVGMIYAIIFRLNAHISRAEVGVFRRDGSVAEGKRAVTEDDPLGWELLQRLEKPNEIDCFGDYLCDSNMQLNLTGSAITWKVPSDAVGPSGRAIPARLYPIKTATAIPQPTVNPDFPDGFYRIQPVYPYGPFSSYPTPSSAVGAPIDARQTFAVRYKHPLLRYDGYSPLTGLNTWIDEFNMIDQSRLYSMKGGINPNAVLKLLANDAGSNAPIPEPELERIMAEFEQTVAGITNMGKLLVPPPGAELEPWGHTPDKMVYESGWDQMSGAILGAMGLTKAAAGMDTDSSYSTLYASLKQLYWTTLEPTCEMFARTMTRHLAPDFGDDLIIEIRCKPLDDHEINFGKFDKATSGKCGTKNEGRMLLGWPPVQEEWGNDLLGDPSPYEKEQAEKQQQQAAMQPGAPGAAPQAIKDQGSEEPEETKQGPPQPPPLKGEERDPLEKTRPDAGSLSEGSLGPRMKAMMLPTRFARVPMLPGSRELLKKAKALSAYEQLMKHFGNGGRYAGQDGDREG
jgi:Phage portal protein